MKHVLPSVVKLALERTTHLHSSANSQKCEKLYETYEYGLVHLKPIADKQGTHATREFVSPLFLIANHKARKFICILLLKSNHKSQTKKVRYQLFSYQLFVSISSFLYYVITYKLNFFLLKNYCKKLNDLKRAGNSFQNNVSNRSQFITQAK